MTTISYGEKKWGRSGSINCLQSIY